MLILFAFLIFYLGAVLGFCLRWWLGKEKSYSGNIVVIKEQGKLTYSLELFENPEKLEYKKQILFKVVTSEESLNRK